MATVIGVHVQGIEIELQVAAVLERGPEEDGYAANPSVSSSCRVGKLRSTAMSGGSAVRWIGTELMLRRRLRQVGRCGRVTMACAVRHSSAMVTAVCRMEVDPPCAAC